MTFKEEDSCVAAKSVSKEKAALSAVSYNFATVC